MIFREFSVLISQNPVNNFSITPSHLNLGLLFQDRNWRRIYGTLQICFLYFALLYAVNQFWSSDFLKAACTGYRLWHFGQFLNILAPHHLVLGLLMSSLGPIPVFATLGRSQVAEQHRNR